MRRKLTPLGCAIRSTVESPGCPSPVSPSGPGPRTPIQAGGCRPAASKAGQMTASDHAQQRSRRFPLPERGRPQMVSGCTSQEQKLAGFRELLHENFDVPGLSRFVLGRFWRIFTPSEQQEFLGLFENFVVLTYSERLLEYADGGGGLRAIGSRPEPDGAVVSSELTREAGAWSGHGPTLHPIRVDWRLSARDGMYKVSDVSTDGLSMSANGRSQLER